jgi:hypothetical protein
MVSKLTLSVDEQLIQYAKAYAAEHGVSVSKLVSHYFELLKPTAGDLNKLKPSRKLQNLLDAGPIPLPDDFTYKQAIHEQSIK